MGSKSNSKATKGNKQNGSKGNSGKIQPQERRADKEQNGESQTDFSMLRKPIDISVSGVGQVVKVYQTGTAEVRQLLAYECDLVYECKVCRNLFRSLANFLSHKRVYCKEQYSDVKHVFPANHLVEDRTTIIQPEAVPPAPCTESWVTSDAKPDPLTLTGSGEDSEGPSSPHIETSIPRISAFSNPKKDLSQIVERLSQKRGIKTITETVGHISATKFYENVSEHVASQRDARKEHVIRLEAIENTRFGVFQTVIQSGSAVQLENTDLMKAQVVELHNMMTCNEATLGPDGQIAVMNGEGTTSLALSTNNEDNSIVPAKKQDSAQNSKVESPKDDHVCTICNTRFSTQKTLNHHMKSLHVTFRMCYPCPCCKNTFCNTWSVYRHLYKVHRKTTLQVRKLRSQIVNKAFRKEVSDYESQNSNTKSGAVPAQTEADKARKEQQRLQQENQAWMNNFEEDLELQMCGGCGRRFERRAALNSHSQICQKRIAIQNNTKPRRPSPSMPTTSTSSRITSTKISPTDKHQFSHADNSRNEVFNESSTSRLTPLSVMSETGVKCLLTPSPSPVPHDVTNQTAAQLLSSSPNTSYHRTRHCSGSRVDCTKKDVPEKRIEIQIRRDYCKTGTGSLASSTVVGSSGSSCQQQDCNSETNENPCVDSGEGNNHAEVSDEGDNVGRHHQPGPSFSKKDFQTDSNKLEENSEISDNKYTESDEKITVKDDEESNNDTEIKVMKFETDEQSSIQSVQNVASDTSEKSFVSGKRRTYMRVRLKKNLPTQQKSNRESQRDSSSSAAVSDSSDLQDDLEKAGELLEEQTNDTSPPLINKKEEQFSPVMESRMKSMINIRRLQCLPCQKKFNKLTNLRRHVAVHIGWNRYRCIACTFKCFSKCECVTHVIKMHLEKADRDKAQTMVQYIETQSSDKGGLNMYESTDEAGNNESEENDENMTQPSNSNRNNMYISDSKDMEITVNNTCDSDPDEPLYDYDESKVSMSPEYDVIIQAIPSDVQNSVMKEDSDEENYVQSSPGDEEQEEKNEILDEQEDEVDDSSSPDTTDQIKSEMENVIEEPDKSTMPVSTLRLRPKRHRTSTDHSGLEESEAIPSKRALTSMEYQHSSRNVTNLDVEENETHTPKTLDMETESNIQNDSSPTSEDGNVTEAESPSEVPEVQQQQTALRKMVLEVIFGSNNSYENSDLEATQNIIATAMNGEHVPSGSASSPEPYEVVETVSSEYSSPVTSNNSSAGSPMLTSDDAASVTTDQTSSSKDENKSSSEAKVANSSSVYEFERRQRPVRNRIKVEREDFIYDLSDRCLDPRRDVEDRSFLNSKLSKRKQDERMRDVKITSEKSSSNGDGSSSKLLPKLMLVRTSMGEYSGVKMVKTGNSSSMTQTHDGNNSKNSSSNTINYNISTRKSQRTFDISPHKVPNSNND